MTGIFHNECTGPEVSVIPLAASEPGIGATALTAGWGQINNVESVPILNKVEVSVISDSVASDQFVQGPEWAHLVCAGSGAAGTCRVM